MARQLAREKHLHWVIASGDSGQVWATWKFTYKNRLAPQSLLPAVYVNEGSGARLSKPFADGNRSGWFLFLLKETGEE
jgi:hypothetical protein